MNILLAKGSTGHQVKELQKKLNKILGTSAAVDGDFGPSTDKLVRQFQKKYNLKVDGIVGNYTWKNIEVQYNDKESNLMTFGKSRFVVFVDAGHGGCDSNGTYTTAGKRAFHANKQLHQSGNYYEGYENRIVAEMFIEECTKMGIQTVRTYHPYKDTSLKDRCEIVKDWLNRGYFGYLHSFHSNAIASTNSPAKMLATRGFSVYTTTGQNISDEIAEIHMQNVKEKVGDWKYRYQKTDGDSDYEANFYILRNTDLEYYAKFGAILEEFGFHTSSVDCEFIIQNRKQRTEAAVTTALWTKDYLSKD
jgi:peptidoglycan hydrolase-like protein with peptidoglycan-binding domain